MTTQSPESPADFNTLTGKEFVSAVLRDKDAPVVVFSLTWCSYCKAVKNLFQQMGVQYRAIDLDTPAFEQTGRYQAIRQALQNLTGSSTLPQVFIAGTALGGYTETSDANRKGTLQALLSKHNISSKHSSNK